MQVKKQHLELDMEQQTGSKLRMEYVKGVCQIEKGVCQRSMSKEYVKVYCHPAYLTYMQSTSLKMPGWMKLKLESRFLGKISITSDMQMTSHPNARK